MVGFAELHDAQPAKLAQAAQAWTQLATDMAKLEDRTVDELTRPMRHSGWQGPAATSAFGIFDLLDDEFELAALQVRNLASVMRKAAEEFTAVRQRLQEAIGEATEQGLEVTAAGYVRAPRPSSTALHDPDGQDLYRRKQIDASHYEDVIRAIVRKADDLDFEFSKALYTFGPDFAGQMLPGEWQGATNDARGVLQLMGLSEQSIPRLGSNPQAVAAWWRGLTEDQRNMYLSAYPQLVGSLNGLPASARDQANKMGLREWIADYQQRNAKSEPGFWNDYPMRRANGLLTRLEDGESNAPTQQLYLLGVDNAGDGKAVVAVGNPDTAAHTAVLVPGVNTDQQNFGSLIDRATATQGEADRLTTSVSGDVSVIAWLGYDPPSHLPPVGAPFGRQSEIGAQALDSFVDGLRASHEPGSNHITAVGHSYGSTVIGHAATHGDGLAVDDVVTLGSPGMRTDHASDLNVGARHVWASAAADDSIANPGDHKAGWLQSDPVQRLISPFLPGIVEGIHGPSPHYPAFGANAMQTDTAGHGGYWEPNSESLRNQARIITGQYREVGLTHGEAPS